MKIKIAIAVAVLILGSLLMCKADPTTNAPSVTVAWDVHPDQSVVGYKVFWGIASRTYTNNVQLLNRTNNSVIIGGLVRATTYYFAATAFTDQGLESDYSNEATYATTPIPAPVTGTTVTTKDP